MLTDIMHGHQLPYDGLRNFAQVICSTHIGLFDVLCHKLTGMDGDNASVVSAPARVVTLIVTCMLMPRMM